MNVAGISAGECCLAEPASQDREQAIDQWYKEREKWNDKYDRAVLTSRCLQRQHGQQKSNAQTAGIAEEYLGVREVIPQESQHCGGKRDGR